MLTATKNKCLFTTSFGILISFVVTRCSPVKNRDYWNVCFPPNLPAHFYVAARLKPGNNETWDYFIFAKGFFANHRVTLGAINSAKLEAHRFDNLAALAAALRNTKIEDSTAEHFNDDPIPIENSADETPPSPFDGLRSALKALFRDENFRTLLRAEGFYHIPDVVWREISSARERMLANVVNDLYVTQILMDDRIRRYISKHHGHLLGQLQQVA
jgi:hypothetical protein